MDELKLLREMRGDIPAVSDDVVDGGRARLLQRIGAGNRTKSRRRTKSFPLALGPVATLGLVAVLVATNVIGLAGWRGAASAQAAEVLNQAADLTIKAVDPVVGPGQYLKIDSTEMNLATYGVPDPARELGENVLVQWLDTEKMSMYVPSDRSKEWVWLRSRRTPIKYFDKGAKEVAREHAKEMGGSPEVLKGAGGAFYGSPSSFPDTGELAGYSRNPRMLLNGIYLKTLGSGQSVDGEALVFIADLLRTGIVPADLRAALYKAAALIPGVTITDNQATLDGQTGMAIGRDEGASHMRQEIIIAPDTGQLIGERSVMTEASGSIPAGTVVGWTTVRTTVVDSAP